MNYRWREKLSLNACALLLAAALSAQANIVSLGFDADLTSGTFSGTEFTGSFSYDNSTVNPADPQDFVSLLSFDFDLGGVHFNRSNIDQGGQAIFSFGELSNVTAAFVPSVNGPANAPVSDIAFGFGGPGVIGYIVDNQFGSGTFTIVPEPRMAMLLVCICIAGFVRSRCILLSRK